MRCLPVWRYMGSPCPAYPVLLTSRDGRAERGPPPHPAYPCVQWSPLSAALAVETYIIPRLRYLVTASGPSILCVDRPQVGPSLPRAPLPPPARKTHSLLAPTHPSTRCRRVRARARARKALSPRCQKNASPTRSRRSSPPGPFPSTPTHPLFLTLLYQVSFPSITSYPTGIIISM